MKVKITKHDYTPAGTIVEVPEGMGKYMVETGQAVVIEEDSPVAHDMGSISNAGNAYIPEKIVEKANPKVKQSSK